MCGITGFSWEDKSLIKKMTSCIAHRGPDSSGHFTDKNISLGHRRLSIIDLSPKGNQPMFNEPKSLVIVFNGEIYNFKEIKSKLIEEGLKFKSDGDTEVILRGYDLYGTDIFSMLDGMFALAIYDKKKKQIILARDRIGKKPLYYSIKNKELIFSSEIKSLLEAEVSNQISKEIMLKTIMSRFSPGNDTVFSDIKKLPSSSYGIFSKGELKIFNYWSLPNLNEEKDPDLNQLDEILEKSIEKRLISDVPVGVLLSGGLDSSAIVSYMSRKVDKVKTFSVGFTEGLDESKYSRLVSEHFGTDHKEIMLDRDILSYLPQVVYHMDEPISDPAALPTYVLSEEISKHVKVALSGEGGDEIFGGYDTVNRLSFLNKINKIPRPISYTISQTLKLMSSLNKYPKKQIYNFGSSLLSSKNLEEAYKKLYYFPFNEQEIKEYTGDDVSNILDSYLQKDLYKTSINFYFKEWLPNDLLMKVDKTSMAHGLEVRTPFLDKDLIAYMFDIKREYKINKKLFREVIKNKLPEQIIKRKKQGFSLPISTWSTKNDFIDRISPHISDLSKRGIFKTSEITNLINKPTDYRNDHKIWTLLNLELWNKIYVDNIKPDKIKL
jgi:asparagine synthase (glutamine-hydrolysing)